VTPRVVLVGLPGSGKSTTGRRLAKILGIAFADTDDLVETATGKTVRDLFAVGEDAFRDIEAAAIETALHTFDGVLALGGGALNRLETREALRDSGVPVVLLKAAVPVLVERIGDGSSRPLLTDDPQARLAALAAEREAAYREVASWSVETDGWTPGQAAAHIAARLHDKARS
jgi:shikimate kinase